MTSVREGSFLLTDGYSIPGPQASPERCQDLERNSHGEADWHFFTPTCLISAATSRHVGHDSHCMNAAPSHRHIRTAMGAAAEQIGQWWLWIFGQESFKSVKLNKAMKFSVLLLNLFVKCKHFRSKKQSWPLNGLNEFSCIFSLPNIAPEIKKYAKECANIKTETLKPSKRQRKFYLKTTFTF